MTWRPTRRRPTGPRAIGGPLVGLLLATTVVACTQGAAPGRTESGTIASGTAPRGTGPTARGPLEPGVVTVAAAASLRDPFTAIGAAFERAHPGVTVRFTFDSSATLAAQIENGAPIDVLAAADEASTARVAAAGLARTPAVVFATNRLAIAVPAGNPGGVRGLADLSGAGVVALCAADAPCGRYAAEVLDRAHVVLPPDRVTRGPNAAATVQAVSNGDAGAAVVYATDIHDPRITAVAIDPSTNITARYTAVAVGASPRPDLAAAFIDEVLGSGQDALRAAGFRGP